MTSYGSDESEGFGGDHGDEEAGAGAEYIGLTCHVGSSRKNPILILQGPLAPRAPYFENPLRSKLEPGFLRALALHVL